MEDRVRVLAPEYAAIAYAQPAKLNEIQDVLRADEVIIKYYLGEQSAYVFLISKDDFETIQLDNSGLVSDLISDFKEGFIEKQKIAISTNNRLMAGLAAKNFYKIADRISSLIWDPINLKKFTVNKKLIIIPDGQLHYLPFELLFMDSSQKEFHEYNYLINQYEISYYSSASILFFERTKEEPFVVPSKTFFGLGISYFHNTNCTNDSSLFSPLIHSAPEVTAISQLFPRNSTTILVDDQAQENYVKTMQFQDYRYLHFSTHGIIDTETPDFSSILLQQGGNEDGCLNIYEIFNLDFNADLVSLSACQTGLGKLVQGEGMVGFTQALMYAGTPSVILSLWEVADESTNQLFKSYYNTLAKEGSNKYASLRSAQLQMIHSEKYSNPYYWAPFVFIGERGV